MKRTAIYLLTLLLSLPLFAATPKHEMRGVWVATVMNIDWPQTRGTTEEAAEAQRMELIQLFDSLETAGANAMFLQVRPMADALYRSSLEPWSSYLSGTRGSDPGWDPLQFAIDEAHARGMELHAWINPFRFGISTTGDTPQDRKAIDNGLIISHQEPGKKVTKQVPVSTKARGKKRRRKTTKTVTTTTAPGKKFYIFDPANPKAVKHLVDVCTEITDKYDIDGIIFDDYFYPSGMPLPSGEDPEKAADQRRAYVNKAIKAVHAMIQKHKPWVRYGIAPAGVGGGNGKATARYNLLPPTAGHDWMYDKIFCDPLAWLAEGTVDYVSPQIYWTTSHSTNPYEPIADWWANVARHFHRHSYPSHSLTNVASTPAHWREQATQINIDRKSQNPGSVLYSMTSMSGKRSGGLANYLGNNQWNTPALMPSMTWKHPRNPGKVEGVKVGPDGLVTWKPNAAGRYLIYAIPASVSDKNAADPHGKNFMPEYIAGVSYITSFQLPDYLLQGYRYAVAPYDRYGFEWDASMAK